jgi:hypothetical protein
MRVDLAAYWIDRLVPLHDLARRTGTVRSDLIEDLREEMTVALD